MSTQFTATPVGDDGWSVDLGNGIALTAHGVGGERGGRRATVVVTVNGVSGPSDRVKLASRVARRQCLLNIAADTSVTLPADAEKALDVICKAVQAAERGVPAPAVRAERPAAISQATRLVQLAREDDVELFHTPGEHVSHVAVRVHGHRETYKLVSQPCREWLARRFYERTEAAPNSAALHEAIATLSGIAKWDGPERSVFVRIAAHQGDIYVDLGDADWRAVRITPSGWHVVEHYPVHFKRPKGILPLPAPVRGGSITSLRPFVNIGSDDDFVLAVSWLVAAMRPAGPYAGLNINGEQGSAKSTTARVLRSLVDPHSTPLRSAPREDRDLMIAASNAHVCAFDNLSKLPTWLSDALCRLSTGGGFSTRALYTDDEETMFNATRPVLFTAITDVAIEGDLADRMISLSLPMIDDRHRQTEEDLWRAFEAAKPRILGALFSAVAVGLRELPHTRLVASPRMADFATWAVAVESAWPWPRGRFEAAYDANRRGATESSLEGDALADVARALTPWEGTSAQLLNELTERTPEEARKGKDWLKHPRQVSDALSRLAPRLRRVGIAVVRPKRTGKSRLIRLVPVGDARDTPITDVVTHRHLATPKTLGNDAGDADDAVCAAPVARGAPRSHGDMLPRGR